MLVYTQFLDAYKTVTSSMAALGVRWNSSTARALHLRGRLNAKVDKVDNVVTRRRGLKSKSTRRSSSGDVL